MNVQEAIQFFADDPEVRIDAMECSENKRMFISIDVISYLARVRNEGMPIREDRCRLRIKTAGNLHAECEKDGVWTDVRASMLSRELYDPSPSDFLRIFTNLF